MIRRKHYGWMLDYGFHLHVKGFILTIDGKDEFFPDNEIRQLQIEVSTLIFNRDCSSLQVWRTTPDAENETYSQRQIGQHLASKTVRRFPLAVEFAIDRSRRND